MPTDQTDDALARLDRALLGVVTTAREAAQRIEHWRTTWVSFDPKGVRRPPLAGLLKRAEADLPARGDPHGGTLKGRRLRQHRQHQAALVQSLRKAADQHPDPVGDLRRDRDDERAALGQVLELLNGAIADARAAVRAAASCLDTQATPAIERISAILEADLVRLTSLFPTHPWGAISGHEGFARHEHVSPFDATALTPLLERLRIARERIVPVMVAWRRFAPAEWFHDQFGIPKDRLRAAARRGRLAAIAAAFRPAHDALAAADQLAHRLAAGEAVTPQEIGRTCAAVRCGEPYLLEQVERHRKIITQQQRLAAEPAARKTMADIERKRAAIHAAIQAARDKGKADLEALQSRSTPRRSRSVSPRRRGSCCATTCCRRGPLTRLPACASRYRTWCSSSAASNE